MSSGLVPLTPILILCRLVASSPIIFSFNLALGTPVVVCVVIKSIPSFLVVLIGSPSVVEVLRSEGVF